MEIRDFKPLLQAIDELDKEALIIFDIDDTLIMAKDKILCSCGEKYLMSLTSQWGQKIPIEKLTQLQSMALLQREIEYTDPDVALLFEKLQEKQTLTLALTAMPTGSFGLIPSLEKWRHEELARFGLTFSFKNSASFLLEEFEKPPAFYRGILFSVNHSKGKILRTLFDKLDFRPSKILFIDDRLSNISSVHEEMKKMAIACQTFHYLGATFPNDIISEEIVKFQFQHLIKEGFWLSDHLVKEMLRKF